MNSKQDSLISSIYEAIEVSHDFEKVSDLLRLMNSKATADNNYQLWHLFFSGILAEEQDQDWAQAENFYLQILNQDAPKPLRATTLLSAGICYGKMARWQESVIACEQSASLWKELQEHVRYAVLLRQIAISYINGYISGDFDLSALGKARERCSIALATLTSLDEQATTSLSYESAHAAYIAATHQTLGEINIYTERFTEAKECFQYYYETAVARKDTYRIGYAKWNLADTYHLEQSAQWQLALDAYNSAISLLQDSSDVYIFFKVVASKGALLQKHHLFDEALILYDQSLSMIEQIRAGISSESARIGFFSTVINVYAKAIQAQMSSNNTSKMFNLIERARARSLIEKLKGYSDYSEQLTNIEPITYELVQNAIPDDTLILEIFTTGLLAFNGRSLSKKLAQTTTLFPESQTLLIAITKGETTAFDAAISPNDLIPDGSSRQVDQHFLNPQIRTALYTKLVAPIAHLLENKRRIYIIPHGPLHYVPFHALIAPDGETLLRDGGPEIVYAPSATILFRDLHKKDSDGKNEPPSGSCLAIGYNGDEGSALRFAEDEATYISDLAGGTKLVGPTLKKDEFYAQAPNYRSLHFSCHGEFDPESPLESLLHIGPNETLTGQEIIDNLQLRCDLVTLSACESGLSKVQRGDELYGLIRAFMYAGASAIIATLWRVDERSTLIFAEKFYQLMLAGDSYATAVNKAQLYLKNLTRKEALAVLTRHMHEEERASNVDLLDGADTYLKSLAATIDDVQYDLLPDADEYEDGTDKVFADPKYWAPFVLIGDPQIHAKK